MHFPDRRPDQTEERILPLINVVFLLLIFFMIAGSLSVTEPFDVAAPSSTSRQAYPADNMLILMSSNGQLALDNELVTEAQLLETLKGVFEAQPETGISLKVDGQLPANRVVLFTQSLYAIGVKKLHLMTLSKTQ